MAFWFPLLLSVLVVSHGTDTSITPTIATILRMPVPANQTWARTEEKHDPSSSGAYPCTHWTIRDGEFSCAKSAKPVASTQPLPSIQPLPSTHRSSSAVHSAATAEHLDGTADNLNPRTGRSKRRNVTTIQNIEWLAARLSTDVVSEGSYRRKPRLHAADALNLTVGANGNLGVQKKRATLRHRHAQSNITIESHVVGSEACFTAASAAHGLGDVASLVSRSFVVAALLLKSG